MAVNRIAACIEYDGTAYSGWQRQGHIKNTIQEKLEDALSIVANEPVVAQCAGRTDRGVHATMQIAHFDTGAERTERSWVKGTNTHLPDDIAVKWVKSVDESFHARFRAVSREYHYILHSNPLTCGAVNRFRTTWDYRQFDVKRMQEAGKQLLGEHDFSSFRASECQSKTPVKTIQRLEFEQRGDFIILAIKANAFLHHMVRNIMGVMMTIGAGEKDVSWAEEVLLARDRRAGGVTAKPDGLYLTQVNYPEEYQLPVTRSGIILLS
ncbi:MAG: tRNA pseudouridine(38-40) synthase TruA [Gammaproteobacteria bacterium]|nr:tRNA pseudouridine(38-40) synthase TruA [Gammaproteobacteria bacterium]